MTRTLAAFALLQAGDVASTLAALSAGGSEMNPVVRWVLGYGGAWSFVGVKAELVLAVLILSAYLPAQIAGPWRVAVQVANVGMAFVVLSNAGIALR
ncbi:MAG TPA: DUF5658 family protein [Candidatus Dormibacteraeota bacterium]